MDKPSRRPISAADLYVLLNREFKRRQARTCEACQIPLPFRVTRSDASGPNWEIIPPAGCGYECAQLAEDLAAELGRLYELKASNGSTG